MPASRFVKRVPLNRYSADYIVPTLQTEPPRKEGAKRFELVRESALNTEVVRPMGGHRDAKTVPT